MQSATTPPRANPDQLIINRPFVELSSSAALDCGRAPAWGRCPVSQRRRSIANLPAPTPTPTEPVEFRTHELQIDAPLAGLRLDQALARALPQYSRARLQGWIEAGAVRVDGQVPRARDKVHGGEQVRIEARLEPETRVAAEELPVDVVHEDRGIFVVNKPAGLVVHPGAGNANRTLQNALLALDPKL